MVTKLFTFIFLILTAFGIATSSAFAQTPADDCPTISLDQGQGTAAGIPVWNQKNTPACFAYTAALLATVWVRQQWSVGENDLALYSVDPKRSYKKMKRSREFPEILDADRGRTCEATEFILKQARNKLADPTNPHFSLPVCEMYGFTQEPGTGNNLLRDPKDMEAQMHRLLQDGPLPLPFSIEYCAETFNYPGKDLIINRTFRPSLSYLNDPKASRENFAPKCGFHAAVVTGQAMRNGVCEFRVRNSAGAINGTNIEWGYFWIPASDLAKNTIRVITLHHE